MIFCCITQSSYELEINLRYVKTPKSILIKPQHVGIEFGYTMILRQGPLPTITEINFGLLNYIGNKRLHGCAERQIPAKFE